MQKWEYCFVEKFQGALGSGTYLISPDGSRTKKTGGDLIGTEAIKVLNEMGELGWEVVTSETTWRNEAFHRTLWTLKREIQAKKE
jgi:hypothetical protein